MCVMNYILFSAVEALRSPQTSLFTQPLKSVKAELPTCKGFILVVLSNAMLKIPLCLMSEYFNFLGALVCCQSAKKPLSLTAMLATFENVPFPGHNHLLTTGTDDTIL